MRLFSKLILGAVFIAAASAVQAGDLSPADNKAMHDYALSMDKVKAMQAAMDDYKAAVAKDPKLASESKDVGDDSKSIAQMEAKFQSNPKLMSIYSRHGISSADAVLMPLTLMSASVAVQYPSAAAKLSAQTSQQQIDFVKTHGADLKKMTWLYGSSQ
jgi:hypothetical protein